MKGTRLSRPSLCDASKNPVDHSMNESIEPIQIQEGNPFIPYDPALAEELKAKKTEKYSVSGRLLSLVYKRLSFWSRYAKHKYNGKRYFWKSQHELSEEIGYSTKQINRALKVLEELGLIIREKIQKKLYRQVYFYFLPQSVHTKEIAPPGTRDKSRGPSRQSTSGSGAVVQERVPQPPVEPPEQGLEDSPPHPSNRTTRATGGLPRGSSAFVSSRSVPSIKTKGGIGFGENVPIYNRRHPYRKNTLANIVEICEFYGRNGINREGRL